jgi:branched-chain amino acid aminotransferase
LAEQAYEHLWRCGQIVPSRSATVHVRSVGHASVSAVFEGINGYWNAARKQLYVFRLRDHLKRLMESIRLVHLASQHSAYDLEAATVDLLRANNVRRDVHIRPWTFVAGDPLEQMAPPGAATETIIDSWPFSSGLEQDRVRTAAFTAWTRIGINTMPPRAKAFSNYHNGRLGNIDALRRGADWPIFLNQQGHVAESSGAAIGFFKDGVFNTPDLGSGLLRSITRETVIDLLREELDVAVVERSIERSELALADELVFLGTSAEVLPIVALDGLPIGIGTVGPMTAQLRAEYLAVVRGERPQRIGWLTPVWPAQQVMSA